MTPTRVTMARVAMRAAIWTFLRVVNDGPDEAIDSLCNDAVVAVDAVMERQMQNRCNHDYPDR